MRQAARLRATFVIVPANPLADVAEDWRAMWDLSAESRGAAEFEGRAPPTRWPPGAPSSSSCPTTTWSCHLVARAETGPDLYLGPLRGARPRRVAVARRADGPVQAAGIVDTLRSLEHGPWWPPLDELLDAVRRFYAVGSPRRSPQRRS